MKKDNRERFGGQFGVLMAMAGSAIGLGNMWRFPYLTAENGGAAFILIYIILMLLISLPTFLAEFLLGRRTRANAVTTFAELGHPEFKFVGILSILASVLVISFYIVVGGWTTKYLMLSCAMQFKSPSADYAGLFSDFVSSSVSPLILTFIFLGATAFIIMAGVKKGIEKFSKIMMCFLFVIIIIVAIRSVTLPGAMDGVRYLLIPDFSKLNGKTLICALGQSFFSLGLGCGAILTYGSYVRSQEDITRSSIYTALLDTLFAIVAGIAIIPAIFAIASMNGYAPDVNAGPGLVFITLPGIFSSMPMGGIISVLFFLSLLLAAITSSISLMEPITAFIIERYRVSRKKATIVTSLLLVVLGSICSLSQGILKDIHIFGYNIFDFMDKASANVFMTSSCLLLLIFTGWVMKKEDFMDEISAHGHSTTPAWLHQLFYFLIKYVAPLGVITIIISNIFI